ncbi:uncharacterized protein [Acropora muricata]|uniref:uncharacterized protein isoform X1 n=1 Tax=Acropora muricata TaxID=159855 RepID=UPI0034E4F4D2
MSPCAVFLLALLTFAGTARASELKDQKAKHTKAFKKSVCKDTRSDCEVIINPFSSYLDCETYRGQCDQWCGFCSPGGLQRCSDVFPVSRCLFALNRYDAGGKRTLEGAERLAVTARTIICKDTRSDCEVIINPFSSYLDCETYRGQCDQWCGFCSPGGLQRCSDVFPVSRCLFALSRYDAGGKRTLEGAERLAVTARTITETAFSSVTLETSRIVNKPFKPWKVVLELNEKLISGKDKIIIGSRVAPKSTYFCAPYMLELSVW